MKHILLDEEVGSQHLLLGNEAIVRGALEAGVEVITCYPGTPSSEVPDTFYKLRQSQRFFMEYSVNEKVALEVACGASLAGAMTLVTMKHVGVNVAADPIFTLAYTGSPGGFLLLSADDPACHSSQDEQDNRYYARMAGLPCFEPVTAEEAKEMTKEALLLSRYYEQPFLLRTTTRLNHLRASVSFAALPKLGELADNLPPKPFKRNPKRFIPVPAVARVRHPELIKNLELIASEVEKSKWNKLKEEVGAKLGIISSGMARVYLHDALLLEAPENKLPALKILELGFTYPLPEKLLADFLQGLDKVLVLEELEPLLEQELRALVNRLNLQVKIIGKTPQASFQAEDQILVRANSESKIPEFLTRFGEYSTRLIRRVLFEFLDLTPKDAKTHPAFKPVLKNIAALELATLPNRPPTLCAGCSHRAVYYVVRKVFGDNAYYSNDIGCYTLGLLPPLAIADFLYCMGSSISAGSGFAKASGKTTLAFIGDSTFFHSGITGLVNAVFNKHDLLVVILDNGTTAMTGHQPNPGVEKEVLGEACVHLDIEKIVRGCGVEEVAVIKPFNLKATVKTFEEMKDKKGVRVVIAKEPCVLFVKRNLKKVKPQIAHIAEQDQSIFACQAELACPAFVLDENSMFINEDLCAGCMVCLQIAPKIKTKKRVAE